MTKIFKVAFATLIALVLLNGCADNTSGVWANSQGESRVDNGGLGQDVTLSQLDSRYVGDVLQGIALATSRVSTDLRLQYKFTWLDAQGLAIDEEGSAWKSLTLHGKQSVQISAVAPNFAAKSYEVYLREAHSN